jgi:hypothetical protein
MIDMGIRCFRTALKTPEFQSSSMGKVNAVFRELIGSATKLLSHYTTGGKAKDPPNAGEIPMTASEPTSSDADAAPDAEQT